MLRRPLVVILAGLLSTGCITITELSETVTKVWGNGRLQDILITSDPPGATVVAGSEQVTTPGMLKLNSTKRHLLTVTRDGYRPETIVLSPHQDLFQIGGSYASVYKLRPSQVHVILKPVH